jgi:hypothetical protein
MILVLVSGCITDGTAGFAGQGINDKQIISAGSASTNGLIRPVIACHGIPNWVKDDVCDEIEYTITNPNGVISYIDPVEEGSQHKEYDYFSVSGRWMKISASVCTCSEEAGGSSELQRFECESLDSKCDPSSIRTESFQYIEAYEPLKQIN